MTFNEWFFGQNDVINPGFVNPSKSGQWGLLHIIILMASIATIVAIALVFRKRSEKVRKNVMWALVGIILVFEIVRRIKNIISIIICGGSTFNDWLYLLLPRPWCAISCWGLIIAAIFKKKYLFNISSIMALLCAIIFFAYPSAGFNNVLFEFENIYSIVTHSLLLVTSISLITLKFTDFKYKDIWKEMICLAVIFLYAILETYWLEIASNPLYMLPMADNEVQQILGVGNVLYVVIYFAFLALFINVFYLIGDRKNIFKKHNKKK